MAFGCRRDARTVARYLPAHIPGNPSTIVQNMPGAGSLTSVRYLDVNAPKDGTAMTVFNSGLVTQSIFQPEKVQLDDLVQAGLIAVLRIARHTEALLAEDAGLRRSIMNAMI